MSETENQVAPGTVEDNEDFASLLAAQSARTSARLAPGQKVTGVVIAISGDNVFVDVGLKVDGVMERKDILDVDGKETAGPGDSVEAWVTAVTGQEIRLSRSASGSGVAALEDARDAGLPVEGRITAVCKGGYLVSVLGKNAFCPGSQMDSAFADPESVVGQSMDFLVIRVEQRGRNIVVSRRALVERERKENIEKVIASIAEGDIIEGPVTRMAPFGAFVELAPGVEGMVHISELSWTRVGAPDEAVSLGETVRAKVLSLKRGEKGDVRISLSRKQAEGDPWQTAEDRFPVGTKVEGKVESRTKFGIFVTIAPGITGLLPNSTIKLAKNFADLAKLEKGEPVSLVIQSIDVSSRRLSLAPEGSDSGQTEQPDNSWKEHLRAQSAPRGSAMGSLAEALNAAMKKKA